MKRPFLVFALLVATGLCGQQGPASPRIEGLPAVGDDLTHHIMDLTMCSGGNANVNPAAVLDSALGRTDIVNGQLSNGGYGWWGGGTGIMADVNCSNSPPADIKAKIKANAANIQCLNTSGSAATCGSGGNIVLWLLGYSVTQDWSVHNCINCGSNWVPASGGSTSPDSNSAVGMLQTAGLASGVIVQGTPIWGEGLTSPVGFSHAAGYSNLFNSFPSTSAYYNEYDATYYCSLSNPCGSSAGNDYAHSMFGATSTMPVQVQAVVIDPDWYGYEYLPPCVGGGGATPCTPPFAMVAGEDNSWIDLPFALVDYQSEASSMARFLAGAIRLMKMAEYQNIQLVGLVDRSGMPLWGTQPSDARGAAVSAWNHSYEYQAMQAWAERELYMAWAYQYRTSTGASGKTSATLSESRSGNAETVTSSVNWPYPPSVGDFAYIWGTGSDMDTPQPTWGTANIASDGRTVTWASDAAGNSLTDPLHGFDARLPGSSGSGCSAEPVPFNCRAYVSIGASTSGTVYASPLNCVGASVSSGSCAASSGDYRQQQAIYLSYSVGGSATGAQFSIPWAPGCVITAVSSNSFTCTLPGNATSASGGTVAFGRDGNIGGLAYLNVAIFPAWSLAFPLNQSTLAASYPNYGFNACSDFAGNKNESGQNSGPGNHLTSIRNGEDYAVSSNTNATACRTLQSQVGTPGAWTTYQVWAASHTYTGPKTQVLNAGPPSITVATYHGDTVLANTQTTARVHMYRITSSPNSTCTSGSSNPFQGNNAAGDNGGGSVTDNTCTWKDLGVWPLADKPGPWGDGEGETTLAQVAVDVLSGKATAMGNVLNTPTDPWFVCEPWWAWILASWGNGSTCTAGS
jgi:hypothetical protein